MSAVQSRAHSVTRVATDKREYLGLNAFNPVISQPFQFTFRREIDESCNSGAKSTGSGAAAASASNREPEAAHDQNLPSIFNSNTKAFTNAKASSFNTSNIPDQFQERTSTGGNPLPEMDQPAPRPSVLENASDGNDFRLIIRQQAEVARACGFGERDRRVLDPPPILECVGPVQEYLDRGEDEAMGPTFVAFVNLLSEDGAEDITVAFQPGNKSVRMLVGNLTTSAAAVYDDNGHKGLFFTFADISCRSSGRFRLHFSMTLVDPVAMTSGMPSRILATTVSDVFTAYPAKDFPGMRKATPLTKAMKDQGVPIPAKKSRAEEPSRPVR